MNLSVTFQGGTRFSIASGLHQIVTDQPIDEGGSDAGMSPVELFIGSLASCIGYFVAKYCARHQIPTEGFTIDVDWSMTEQPHRVGVVNMRLNLPVTLNPSQKERLLKIARGCTVHQTLAIPPKVDIRLSSGDSQ